ncbi:MAG: sulfite exporter TauE/SafE family protein [Candidatus Nezhaarchaeota archaeon]|nr:sulfite exporter TauE/SafE family protein [Candidatus Nezhaarchaeota archaeon]
MITASLFLQLLSIALASGFVGAVLGVGGGVIIVPVLSSFLGVPIKEAITASLVSVVATSVASSRKYLGRGLINLRLALFLETAISVGSMIGALIVFGVSPMFLHTLLGLTLVVIAVAILQGAGREDNLAMLKEFAEVSPDKLAKRFNLSSTYRDEHFKVDVKYNVVRGHVGIMLSLLAGLASSLLGIGGGVFKVPIMNRIMNVPIKASTATSTFMVGLTGAAGAAVYLALGAINFNLLTPLVLGSVLGSTAGATVMNKLRASWIRAAFGILLISLAYASLKEGFTLAISP